MEKKYYGVILLVVFLVVAGVLLSISNESNNLEIERASITSQESVGEYSPQNVDLTTTEIDFEDDLDDLSIDSEELENFDEDIDFDSIDEDLF